ncbi:beta-lactamase family protein [Polymorphobacter sp. PAMC 29334]|uniref:serine hydrolase domain-containing protein n=1 Tax=Polymorphobacter sp. PAMC 29334 TaxID=2862331 RepID=UPI001C66CB24|nr:serine hydrolase domain-containing protein [Polymorphobacter sp. PAMC 29334]QYE36342.1 beta-lactamase family protein [Polymorphobacter sp. PAMC 29334]
MGNMVVEKILLGLTSLVAVTMAPAASAQDRVGARTAAGVTYVQPKDWTVATHGATIVLSAPEKDLDIAVVDGISAPTASAAAAKAWPSYTSIAPRAVRLLAPEAARDGWDERVSILYETSPGERAVATAVALRHGASWTVAFINGSDATMNKRAAAADLIERSLRPAGYVRETFAGRTAHRLTPERIAALRDFIATSARTLEVPGVGIALIDKGHVVYEGGYGVLALGSPKLVTAHSKFMIASNTKGMTTLLLAVLADEGRLRWDQKVTELYPAFRLGSDATTRATEVRHLVCACTGLPRKDFAFILADGRAPAADTFRQLGETQPTSAFGELFQYNNLMASAAGYVGGALAYPGMEIGAAYDKAMQTRIFDPLGMNDTTFDREVGESGDAAQPHGYDIDGRMTLMSNHFNHLIAPYRPAGGAWSSASDMARYVELELSQGVAPNGRRVVSAANLLERRRRGVSTGEDAWYGMGLFDEMVDGVHVVTHGGTLQGFHSDFWVLPDAGIGAVLLTNADSGPAMFAPFLRRLLEVAYDGKPEAAAEVTAAAGKLKAEAKARRARLTVPGDATALANLAPKYRDAQLGNVITIDDRNGVRWIEAGAIEGPLATRKNIDGTLSLVSIGPGGIGVDAVIGQTNGSRTLTIRDSQHQYVYTEVR